MFPTSDLARPTLPVTALRVRGVDAVLALLSTTEQPPDHGSPAAITRATDGSAAPAANNGTPSAASASVSTPASPTASTQAREAAPTPTNATAAPHDTAPDPIMGMRENVSLGAIAKALASATAPGNSAALTPLPLPAIDAPVNEPGRFAGALERAVSSSGAFYESHLRDWVEGRSSLEAVRAEPRSQAENVASPLRPSPQSDTNHAMLGRADPTALRSALPISDGAPAFRPESVTTAQLHCAEANEVRVMTEVWPGQLADLVLRTPERGPREQNGGALAEPVLPGSGVLKMSLPHLGELEARIQTDGNEVRYTLHAKNPDTALKLRDSTTALAYGLGLAGLKLVSANVDDHPD